MKVKYPVHCLIPSTDGVIHSASYLHRQVAITDSNETLVYWLGSRQFTVYGHPDHLQFVMSYFFKEVSNYKPITFLSKSHGRVLATNARRRIKETLNYEHKIIDVIEYKEGSTFEFVTELEDGKVMVYIDGYHLITFVEIKRHNFAELFSQVSYPFAKIKPNDRFMELLESYSNSPFHGSDSLIVLAPLTNWFRTANEIGVNSAKFDYVMGMLYNGYSSRYTGMLVNGKHNKMYPISHRDLYELETTVISTDTEVIKHFHHPDGTKCITVATIVVNIEPDKLTFVINGVPWLTVEKS